MPKRQPDQDATSPPSADQDGDRAGGRRPDEPADASAGRIGPYRVLKPVGEGAAGVVYQAEQPEPVRLVVALKVIKEGLDWQQVLASVEAGRQALARLDHPNIAKVFGAGARRSGQPYFVSEWVDGVPITDYCETHRLALKQRLELFETVCQAVQHAHQKGVLHGALKPSNVLVAGGGDSPTPKVLDFGVAQATRPGPGTGAARKAPGDSAGGAEYMSPEQADADSTGPDTRADVYSLGAILYELLTGTPPLARERLAGVPPAGAARLLREEEVPPPSKRLEDARDGVAVAERRQTKPTALVKELRGELDCLVMKALHKDPSRRYQAVCDLARDLRHYLAHEPVEACPPGGGRRLVQLGREHPRLLAAAAAVVLLLLAAAAAGAGTAVWAWREKGQAQKAEQEAVQKQKKAEQAEGELKNKLHLSEAERKVVTRERDQAREAEKAARHSEADTQAVLTFLQDKFLSAGRPGGASFAEDFWAKGESKDVTLRQAADRVEPQVAAAFTDRPVGEAAVREVLGWVYLNVGEPEQAVKQYRRAFALREAAQGSNSPETADCRNKLAVAYRLARRPAEAARLFDQNPASPTHAAALALRGETQMKLNHPAEAELTLRQCLTIREQIEPDEWTTFDTRSLLGQALLDQKKYAEAEPLLLSGYKGLKKREADIPSPDRGRVLAALKRLVRLYDAWGKKEQESRWRKELEPAKSPDDGSKGDR